MATYIDFKALRGRLDFAQVLARYGVSEARVKSQQLTARCPLPSHHGTSARPSFSADLGRGIWRCFGCKTSGNVLDFAVRMEGRDPRNGDDVRNVALKLQRVLEGSEDGVATSQLATEAPACTAPDEPVGEPPVLVNEPLGFSLKTLDADDAIFRHHGLRPETVAHFGLGVCQRGFLRGRIAIPIHDSAGSLIGYAGRILQLAAVTPEEPAYVFPRDRLKDGVVHRFDARQVVYNAHRLTDVPRDRLIVTEDMSLVWRLWEAGVDAVAVPTGLRTVSPDQAQLLGKLAVHGGLIFVERFDKDCEARYL